MAGVPYNVTMYYAEDYVVFRSGSVCTMNGSYDGQSVFSQVLAPRYFGPFVYKKLSTLFTPNLSGGTFTLSLQCRQTDGERGETSGRIYLDDVSFIAEPNYLCSTSSTSTSTTTSTPTTTSATSTTTAPKWNDIGCYTDSIAARTLRNSVSVPGGSDALTVELCQATCLAAGYLLAGVEWSRECWCDNKIRNGAAPANDDGCNMACTGNAQEICGGSVRLSLYQYGVPGSSSDSCSPTTLSTCTVPSTTSAATPSSTPTPSGWPYAGCYTDNVALRTFSTRVYPPGLLTIESCQAACASVGYSYAGLEWSVECFCTNEIENGGTLAPEDECEMPCAGDALEICGGPSRLSVYSLNAPKMWVEVGCYTDSVGARTLGVTPQTPNGAGQMTIEACETACQKAGYPIAGLEFAQECFCDSEYRNGGGPAPDLGAGCNMACTGDTGEICGGPNRLSVYQLVTAEQKKRLRILVEE